MSAPEDLNIAMPEERRVQNTVGARVAESLPISPSARLAQWKRASAQRAGAGIRAMRGPLDRVRRWIARHHDGVEAWARLRVRLLRARVRRLKRVLRTQLGASALKSVLLRVRDTLDARVIAVSSQTRGMHSTRTKSASPRQGDSPQPPRPRRRHRPRSDRTVRRSANAKIGLLRGRADRRLRAALKLDVCRIDRSLPARRLRLSDPRSLVRRAASLLTGGVAGLLVLFVVAGFFLPAAAVSATQSLALGIAPGEQAALPSLSQRSVVLASDGTVLAVLHDEIDRKVVPLHTIPEPVRQAVITAEDRKFWEHNGYDIEGIGRAIVANVQAGEITQGGSTITQQIAKSVVGNERTLQRKLNEFAYAVALEREYSKDELLERYLNQVYFGWGAYGIAAAAEEYFDQPDLSQLRVEQGALLAGLIRSPGALDPRRHPQEAFARRNEVIRGMGALGYLSPSMVDRLVQTPLGVSPPSEDAPLDPYLTAAVQQEFLGNQAFGPDRESRAELLFSGGLKIETSLDPRLQQIAREVVSDALPSQRGPTAAIAAVDPRDGRILAIYGGADFEQEQFNLATQGRRQPGSSFKPFVLATALQQGLPLRLSLDGNSPLKIPGAGSPEWAQEGVTNFGDADYGSIDLRSALVRSVNTAFAQLMMIVGPQEVLAVAHGMGIDVAAATMGIQNPSIALGGLERGVTPLEMASAYGTFANAGRHVAATLINRVTGPDGVVHYERQVQSQQILDPHVNAAMVSVMQDVVRAGTGSRARLAGWAAAGKTGTTQRNADAWFVGYVPVMSTAVWMGYPEGQIAMWGGSSSSFTASIWRAFMSRALEGVPPVSFPDVVSGERPLTGSATVQVPNVVREDETDALRTLAQAKLIGDLRLVPSRSRAGTVISQRPRPGSIVSAGESVVISVSTGEADPPTPSPEAGDQRYRGSERATAPEIQPDQPNEVDLE
jgi:membrane peptidoglycan carboxypeptidase